MDCKERCRDCAYLIEGDNGEWICDDWGKEIDKVDNSDCAVTKPPHRMSPYERTRALVYSTGNKWAIENFNATH